MDLNQFVTLQRLAREKSFKNTATFLNITQPAVTKRIKMLEEALGQPLVQRLGEHITLTEAGEAFLPYINRILRIHATGLKTIAKQKSRRQPELRVVTTSSIVTSLFPSFLRVWRQKYPETHIALETGSFTDALDMMKDGIADIAILREPVMLASFTYVDLLQDPLYLVVGNDFPLDGDGEIPLPIQRLQNVPFILYHGNFAKITSNILLRHGVIPRVTAALDNLTAIKNMVKAGLGASVLPHSTIKEDINKQTLRMIPVTGLADAPFTIKAVLPQKFDPLRPPLLQTFLTELIRLIRTWQKNK